jgi:hypothetical protein
MSRPILSHLLLCIPRDVFLDSTEMANEKIQEIQTREGSVPCFGKKLFYTGNTELFGLKLYLLRQQTTKWANKQPLRMTFVDPGTCLLYFLLEYLFKVLRPVTNYTNLLSSRLILVKEFVFHMWQLHFWGHVRLCVYDGATPFSDDNSAGWIRE